MATATATKAKDVLEQLKEKLDPIQEEIRAGEDTLAALQKDRSESAAKAVVDNDEEAKQETAHLDVSIEAAETHLRNLRWGATALEKRISLAETDAAKERRQAVIDQVRQVREKELDLVTFLMGDIDDLARHTGEMLELQQNATSLLHQEYGENIPHQLKRSFSVDGFLTSLEMALGSRLHRLGMVSLPRAELGYSLAAHVLPAEKIGEIATAAEEGKK